MLTQHQFNPNHPSSLGVVCYFPINEGGGSKIYDISGNRFTGTLTNFSVPNTRTSGWMGSGMGNGIMFDGTDDYIQTTLALNLSKPFSFMCWQQYSTDTDGAYFSSVNPIDGSNGDLLRSKTTGDLRIFSGSNFSDFTSGRKADRIESVAMTNSAISGGGAGSQSVYLNGRLVGTAARSRSTTNNHNITLGVAGIVGGVTYWKGTLSQCIFWNRVISQVEIQALNANPYLLLMNQSYPG